MNRRKANEAHRPLPVRDSAPSIVGYALLLVACQLTEWGGLGLSERTSLALVPILQYWTVPLLVAMGAMLLAAAALSRGKRACRPLALGSAGGGLMVAGVLWMVTSALSTPLSITVDAAAIGAGTGCLLAAWTWVFSRLSVRDTTMRVLGSLVLYAILFLALSFASLPLRELAYFACVVGSVAALGAALRKNPAPVCRPRAADARKHGAAAAVTRSQPAAAVGDRPSWRLIARSVSRPLFCAAATAFAVAVTRTMTLQIHTALVGDAGVACVLLLSAGLLAYLVLSARRGSDEGASGFSIPGLFGIAFPIVATLLLALSLFGSELALPVSALTFAFYMIMQSLMVGASLAAAVQERLPMMAVYGLFAGCVYLVFALATALGIFLFGMDGTLSSTAPLLAGLLVLYVLAMAYALVRRSSAAEERKVGARPGREEAAEADSTRAHAAPEPIAPGDKSAAPGAVASRTAGEHLPATSDNTGATAPESTADPISQRCQVLIDRFELSPRESEVLVAFAHGRNVSYLAETLVLSPNTIRTHSKTLYAKLGVHSKQELLDLVERQPLA